MSLVNQAPKLGKIILSITISTFLWFTIWVLVSPFYADPCMTISHLIGLIQLDFQAFFPDRRWAITIPVTIGVLILATAMVYLGFILREI